MNNLLKHLLRVVPALALISCVTKPLPTPPATVAQVNLQRYQGKWFEAARLPMYFQHDWINSTAEYTLQPDHTVKVVNRCETKQGKPKMIRGTAVSLDPDSNARLEVTFNEWFSIFIPRSKQGNYWVLDLKPDYSLAAVGTPDRKCLWILARKLPVPQEEFERVKKKCAELGYNTSTLLIDPAQAASNSH
ncbi:lipocalin family protein [soil metagenome]